MTEKKSFVADEKTPKADLKFFSYLFDLLKVSGGMDTKVTDMLLVSGTHESR